ncbi:hypothetical protein BCR42DRAFT_414488 [Absidia repens]|uniref:Uncharacterized protein n=1 Tax=Absidia repens TaxID=90262 RepID=A0A1X2IKP7_9FUNG|nr:hypothetical protein BCR42DRAFT_414488 [Absidia repens]
MAIIFSKVLYPNHSFIYHSHSLSLSLFNQSYPTQPNPLLLLINMKFTFVIAALFAASAIAAPCGRKHVDDVADVPVVDDVPATPAPAPVTEDSHDIEDETKVSSHDEKTQTAVINNNSPDKGNKGSLIGVDVSNLAAGGLLSNTKNEVKQH